MTNDEKAKACADAFKPFADLRVPISVDAVICAAAGDRVYVLCEDEGGILLSGEYEISEVYPNHSCGPCVRLKTATGGDGRCVRWQNCVPLAIGSKVED